MSEPTSTQYGIWFENENVWMQRRPCVVQWTKKSQEDVFAHIEIVHCPGCVAHTIKERHPGQKVKRWLLLPP